MAFSIAVLRYAVQMPIRSNVLESLCCGRYTDPHSEDLASESCPSRNQRRKSKNQLIKQMLVQERYPTQRVNQSRFILSRMYAGDPRSGHDEAYCDLPPNPGIPVNLDPAGNLGRPKFSSRSRMTFRALRLRRYGNGALASSRPTEGSSVDSAWAEPGIGRAR